MIAQRYKSNKTKYVMNLWMVRAGRHGEQEAICLQEGLITIGWNELSDLKKFKTKETLKEEFQKCYNEKNVYALGSKIGQIWRFANEIKKNDLVVLPSKFTPEIHIGIVTGEYKYKEIEEDVYHIIPVAWKKTMSRTEIEEDLLFSFGSLLTVSSISRNNAVERVNALLEEKHKPKAEINWSALSEQAYSIEYVNTDDIAYTKIEKFIQNNFKEYEFEDLIREILKAQGYNTAHIKEIGNIKNLKKKGADGGVDILASKGTLGFEQPSICIQVKSGETQQSSKVLRELVGVMAAYKADFGLLVSWGGFSSELIREAREKYFTIRLWNSDHVIKEIFENYDKFSSEFKIRLPLKSIWVLEEQKEN